MKYPFFIVITLWLSVNPVFATESACQNIASLLHPLLDNFSSEEKLCLLNPSAKNLFRPDSNVNGEVQNYCHLGPSFRLCFVCYVLSGQEKMGSAKQCEEFLTQRDRSSFYPNFRRDIEESEMGKGSLQSRVPSKIELRSAVSSPAGAAAKTLSAE